MAAKSMTQTNQALDRFIRSEMKRTGVPGVGVGVLKGKRRYVNGYGVTNIDHPMAVDAKTLFQIGSTSKTFTATAIVRLVEMGKLDLDVPIRRYLKDLKLKNKDVQAKVTLKHLLTHTGGWLGDYFYDGGRGDDALANFVATMSKVKQLTPLGEVWSYNNSGFTIAGRVIERVTGQPFQTAIRELVFEPLGLERSFFFADEVMPYRTVVGHITTGTKSVVAHPWAVRRSGGPSGGIISDVGDQLKWAAFHMGDGKSSEGKRVLRNGSLALMQKPHAPAGGIADYVGLSWLIREIDGVKLVAHGGTVNGQLSAFLMVPERSFAVTVLTNSTRGGELHREVVGWALQNYLDISQPAPPRMKLTRDELAVYAGTYRIESSGATFDVDVRSGGLTVRLPAPPPDAFGKKQPAPPPIPLYFFDHDLVTASTGYYKGTQGEFLRGLSGKITWFRFGARIQRRVG